MLTRREKKGHRSEGIVLATVLMLIFVLITAVYSFQRRAVIDTMIAQNRIDSGRADTLARGGLRFAEALVVLIHRYPELQEAGSGPLLDGLPPPGLFEKGWSELLPKSALLPDGDDQSLRFRIEDENARLNLSALIAHSTGDGSDNDDNSTSSNDAESAVEYLTEVMRVIIDNMDAASDSGKNYDEREIAENLIDWMDSDNARANGGDEDDYYQGQDPPYKAANRPFLSFDEIGMVQGIDPPLLDAMRDYLTVYPIGGSSGVNLNQAKPWVLSIVYAGTSGDRELLRPRMIEALVKERRRDRIICTETSADPTTCTSLGDIGNGGLADGSFFPEISLPAVPEALRVTITATAGSATSRFQAVFDARSGSEPILLSWRRLRGRE